MGIKDENVEMLKMLWWAVFLTILIMVSLPSISLWSIYLFIYFCFACMLEIIDFSIKV